MERDIRDSRVGDVARVHLPSRQQPQQQQQQQQSPLDGGIVTLTQPRPDLQRASNEYVETPLRTAKATAPGRQQPGGVGGQHQRNNNGHHHGHGQHHHSTTTTTTQPGVGHHVAASQQHHHHHHHHNNHHRVVVKQPHKENGREGGGGGTSGGDSDCSIICRECGRCRCEACRQPRPVPSLWLCDNFCLCSVETCVDYASCLCCVKAALYHCGGGSGDDDDTCSADDPCSCAPHRRTSRWACLALATLLLPCLCCYWPLRSCARISESCYAACSHRGCSCHSHTDSSAATNRASQPPEKRLLQSSPDY